MDLTVMFSIFEELWKHLLQFAWQSPNVINSFTAFFVLCCTGFLVTVWSNRTASEEWAKYFSISYCILSAMFLLMFILGIAEKIKYLGQVIVWSNFKVFTDAVGSGLNNLFILAAARELLGKRRPFVKSMYFVVGMTIGVSLMQIHWPELFLLGGADALFSFFCLGCFGYAMKQQIAPERIYIRNIILIITIVYCIAQIIYFLTPCFIESKFTSFLVGYIREFPPDTIEEKKRFLESLWKILTLPFKALFVYFANYILIRQVVKTPLSDLQEMVEPIHDPEFAFFSKEGVLKRIGETLNADRVIIGIVLPGKRIRVFNWYKDPQSPKKEQATFPLDADLIDTEDKSYIPIQKTIKGDQQLNSLVQNNKTHIYKKIRFLGDTIGALEVHWNGGQSFSSVERRVEGWAALLAPSVQLQRELASLDEIGRETTRWMLQSTTIDFEVSIKGIARIVQDILSPKGTLIEVDFGFRKVTVSWPDGFCFDNSSCIQLPQEMKLDVDVQERDTDPSEKSIQIGILHLVVLKENHQPGTWLGRDQFHRRIVTVLVMELFFDIARRYFAQALRAFYDKLTQERHDFINNFDKGGSFWFKAVEEFAQKIGSEWVIAKEYFENKEFFHGEDCWREVISTIPKFIITLNSFVQSKVLLSIGQSEATDFWKTCSVIKIELTDSRAIIYIGIDREGFGDELMFPSPWRTMLERFGDTLDATIVQWRDAVEKREATAKIARVHALATTASVYGTLAHQIVNLTRDAAGPIKNFNEAILLQEVKIEDTFLRSSMSSSLNSLNHLMQVVSSLANFRMIESERPCSLLKVVQESLHIFTPTLKNRNIEVETKMSETVRVDVPKFAVSMALTNLIDNAKDALTKTDRPNRRITIEAIDCREAVVCKVIDNGEGIPVDQQERIFDFGSTSKKDGGGLGLYLTRLTLSENRSLLTLDSTGPEGTTFSIRFPKVITKSIAKPDSASNITSTHIEE